MALDSSYITTVNLEPYFVSKANGEANANGKIYFWVNTSRTTGKLVYELTQDAMTGEYSYAPLPNPITLSNTGTIQNAGGNNVALYYYPFDEFGNEELYYIQVYDSDSNLQFTRDAWPFPTGASGGGGGAAGVSAGNMITNPQFAKILFTPNSALTISYTGSATTSVEIAPGWVLNVTHTGSTSVVVTQTPVAGSSAYPYNPPYTLDFAIGSSISRVTLTQRLNNNPDWAAPAVAGDGGYLSASILLGSGTAAVINYVPSGGNPSQQILSESNASGGYAQFSTTIELDAAANPATGATGYATIEIVLPSSGTASISNVQVIPLTTDTDINAFDQSTVNRQIDQMFNYYKTGLDFKPVRSYLIGWDFALNPAQIAGSSIGAVGAGANKSYYAWDQTIAYQSANSAITIARATSGAITLTAATTTKMALVQYLPAVMARNLLRQKLASMVSGYASANTTITISLWYTTDGSLPSIGSSNNSLVLTLDANGKPATFNGTWLEVPRELGDATFTLGPAIDGLFNNYGIIGWDLDDATIADSATYFAIVVGTQEVPSARVLTFNSISLVPGTVPTIPAPLSIGETLAQCQQAYEKSFNVDQPPAGALGTNNGEWLWVQTVANGQNQGLGTILYKVSKWQQPTVQTYNTNVNNSAVRVGGAGGADCTSTATFNATLNGFCIQCTIAMGFNSGSYLTVQWTANSLLGF